jgi:hypothetical protein
VEELNIKYDVFDYGNTGYLTNITKDLKIELHNISFSVFCLLSEV